MARRKLIWVRMLPAMTSITSSATGEFAESQDLLQTFRTQAGITAGPVGLTIIRTRMHIFANNSPALLTNPHFVAGIRVMDTTENTAAETLANPYIPANDPHADWMCLEPFAVSGGAGVPNINHYVDVRAQRKLDELGQTLTLIVGSVAPGGPISTTANLSICTSVLVALP